MYYRASKQQVELTIPTESVPVGLDAAGMLEWMGSTLGRRPDLYDLYELGSELFRMGLFPQARSVLEAYLSLPHSMIAGKHLLAFSCAHSGAPGTAAALFTECALSGEEDDWQMAVETALEAAAIGQHVDQVKIPDAVGVTGARRGVTVGKRKIVKKADDDLSGGKDGKSGDDGVVGGGGSGGGSGTPKESKESKEGIVLGKAAIRKPISLANAGGVATRKSVRVVRRKSSQPGAQEP